jgi:ferritin-like metal-binding protein YciE
VELETLRELYIDELKDLYSAEQQIAKALPKMIRKASSRELQRAFTTHLRETERQAKRLERICRDLGVSPKGKKCVGMEGLIDEAKELIDEKPDPDVLDAGLISKAQHVEHYEMAGYGTVRNYARILGHADHAELLQATLDEEGTTDKLLTDIAARINIDAVSQDDDEDEGRSARKSGARKGGRKSSAKKSGAKRGSASKKRAGKRGASSRGALAAARSGSLHARAKALVGA